LRKAVNERGAVVSYLLSVILILLVIAVFVLIGLILNRYYGQVQPKTPLEFEAERWQATIKARPNDAAAHFALGVVYRQMGKTAEAEEELKKAIDLNPTALNYRYELGVLYLNQKKKDKAAEVFRYIVEKNPDDALSWFQLGLIEKERKNYEEAEVAFKNVLRISETYGNVHRELGEIYEKLGEKNKAIEEYRQALKFLPDDKKSKEALKRLGAE